MNITKFTGRLTKEIIIKEHANGQTATAFFTLAVKDDFKSNGAYQTQFIPMQAFIKTDNARQYFEGFSKGDLVAVEGRMKSTSWEKNGTMQYGLQINVEKINLLKKHTQGTNSIQNNISNHQEQTSNQAPAYDYVAENGNPFNDLQDDLPF